MIIRPGWDAPHVRCLPRTFCAWPCLLRKVGKVLGSPCDCIMTGITYANPGSRHIPSSVIMLTTLQLILCCSITTELHLTTHKNLLVNPRATHVASLLSLYMLINDFICS